MCWQAQLLLGSHSEVLAPAPASSDFSSLPEMSLVGHSLPSQPVIPVAAIPLRSESDRIVIRQRNVAMG